MPPVLLWRHHDQGKSYKGKYLIGVDLKVQDFVHFVTTVGRKHGSLQADLGLEELHLDLKAARRGVWFHTG